MSIDTNLKKLKDQAQEMQASMQAAQDDLKKLRVVGKAGGERVKVEMAGDHVVEGVKIDRSLYDEDGFDMVEDLVRAAFNDAVKKVEQKSREKINELTSRLKLPAEFMKKEDDK